MYNKNFFIEEEKENIELKGKNHSISIADRMKNAKQKASQQTKETKSYKKIYHKDNSGHLSGILN